MKSLTIGKIAGQAGLGIETVRFYERKGLIPEPPRDESSGYRCYPEDTVDRLRFVKNAKDLGFSLKEIQELLSLRAEPSESRGDIRARAKSKIENIEQKITSLESMRQALMAMVEECSGKGPRSNCPILKALERME